LGIFLCQRLCGFKKRHHV